MKKSKIMLPVLTLLSTLIFAPCFEALALAGWGPERPTFTWDEPATYAVFNSIADHPGIGDERNFVRIREAGVDNFGDQADVAPGKEYEVWIYYHNNANEAVGQTAEGIADGVRVSANFPATVEAGDVGMVSAQIMSYDSKPTAVWDSAFMKADQDVSLNFVVASAHIYNNGALNGTTLPADLFSEEGMLLGYNKFSGLLPGCNQYAGYIIYKVAAEKPEGIGVPGKLPVTWPGGVVIAVLAVGAISVGGAYWRRSRKALKK
jgi:hypothetical protein